MGQLAEEIRQEQLAWAQRRLAALDKMEAKLRGLNGVRPCDLRFRFGIGLRLWLF